MNPRTKRHGTVLIIVVVIVLLLSLVAYKYLLAMQTEHIATAMYGDRLKAKQSAESARDLLKHVLEMSRAERDELGGISDNPALFAGHTDAWQATIKSDVIKQDSDEPFFGLIATARSQSMNSLRGSTEFENTTANRSVAVSPSGQFFPPTRYGATNESGKLHLWRLMQWEAASPGAGVASLMALPGMDQPTAEALMDWLDPDDEPREQGAESEFYATLTRPIAPRNGIPLELDELLFVKGITAFRLYGTMTELPVTENLQASEIPRFEFTPSPDSESAVRNTWESTSLSETSQLHAWSEWLTIYSAERNESYTGQRRIFINGEDLERLHKSISSRLSTTWANFIVLYRQYGPTESNVPSANNSPDVSGRIDFDVAAEYAVASLADLLDTSVSLPPDSEGEQATIVPSPAGTKSLDTVHLEQVFDQLTTVASRRIIGRVNINQAPAEVLATLPGLSHETAGRIVAARESEGEKEQAHLHPIWLLTHDLVDSETMRALLPDITCGGDVYRAEVWGRAKADTAIYRFETVLDATETPCRATYYRELDVPSRRIKILSRAEFASMDITAQSPSDFGTEDGQRNEY